MCRPSSLCHCHLSDAHGCPRRARGPCRESEGKKLGERGAGGEPPRRRLGTSLVLHASPTCWHSVRPSRRSSDAAQGLAAHGSFPGVLGKQHGVSPSPQRPWPQSGFCRVSCCPWPCPTSASTTRARGSHPCLHTPLWPSLSSADRPRWAPRQLGEAHGCPRASPHGGTLRG